MKLAAPPGLYRGIARWSAAVDAVYLGAVLSVAGGLLWMVSGVSTGLLAGGLLPRSLEVVTGAFPALALVGTLGGIVALHTRQTPGYGWCGRLGFASAFSGCLVLVAGLPLSAAITGPSLDAALFAAFWGLALGLLLMGVATLRLGFLPQWSGALLLTLPPLAVVAGDYGGGLVFGALWMILGRTLLAAHDVSALIRSRESRP